MSQSLSEEEKIVLRKEMMKLKDREILLEIDMNALKWQKVEVLYNLGHSDQIIALSLDISTVSVGDWRRGRGLNPNEREYGIQEIEEVEKPNSVTKGETMNKRRMDLHKRGLSIDEIAEVEGVDKYTIMKHFRERGIDYEGKRVDKNDKN